MQGASHTLRTTSPPPAHIHPPATCSHVAQHKDPSADVRHHRRPQSHRHRLQSFTGSVVGSEWSGHPAQSDVGWSGRGSSQQVRSPCQSAQRVAIFLLCKLLLCTASHSCACCCHTPCSSCVSVCPFVAHSRTSTATYCVPRRRPSCTVWHASRAQWTADAC